ncbi:MAG: bifunctional ADP-heptose synthase [Flavipsychrobacter sp.]
MDYKPMNKEELIKMFDKMNQLHVVVVGDVMLDNYWVGDVDRISPEAPVPVIRLKTRESRLGGAANVAVNCKALGARVTLASIVGNDHEGNQLKELAKEAGVGTELLVKSKDRITTSKTRIISRSQQIVRLDDEQTNDISTEEEHPFLEKVLKFLQIEKPDVLIFEDYNKGILKPNVIERITSHCKEIGTITSVDPKKNHFLDYKSVDIFKPNLKEVREGLNIRLDKVDVSGMDEVHQKLKGILGHQVTFVTLSELGVYYNNGNSAIIPSHYRRIADVSGAGDTVIATASMVYALTKDAALMAAISNIAGGLVCESVGVVSIDKEQLEKEAVKVLNAQ